MMDTVELNICIEFYGNYPFQLYSITEIGICIDCLFDKDQIIEMYRVSALILSPVVYRFIDTATIPYLNVRVHVDKL